MSRTYFGYQTKQALQNFPFSIGPVSRYLIYAIVEIKKAAALANKQIGDLDGDRAGAIIQVCDEILKGKLNDQFPLPALQGGAGTSINMNVNEVIAAKAEEILKVKGKQLSVHPNDHVNMSQSTNDVNPSALKLACLDMGKTLLYDLEKIVAVFMTKAKEFRHVHKLGRTHLQDAVPVTLGEEFTSYASLVERGALRIKNALAYMYELNLGGTAIGTSVNASPKYMKTVYLKLRQISGFLVKPATNLMSQTSSQTDFCFLSQALVSLNVDISKIASDFRLMGSGPNGGFGEIILEGLQAGSSIMPGKVNPVLPESVNQLYCLVSGNNLTIEEAAHMSFLELANMFPVLADRLLCSLKLTDEVLVQFASRCVRTVSANKTRCRELLEKSTAYATLLTPQLGYDAVSDLVKESIRTGKTLRALVLSKNFLTEAEFDAVVKQRVDRNIS